MPKALPTVVINNTNGVTIENSAWKYNPWMCLSNQPHINMNIVYREEPNIM